MTVEERDPLLAAQGSSAMAELRELSVAAADLVTLCSFLAPDDIPRELLLRGAPALSEPLASALDGQLALIELAATIESYGLMRVDGDAFSMHRRIQSTVRDALDDDGRRQWVASAADLVLAAFPDTPEDTRAWPWAARVVPHARRAIESLTEYDAEPVTRIRLLDLTGRFLTPQGQLDTARELLEAALEAVEQVQPDTMLHGSVLNHFVVLEREQGHFKDARRDARRALAIHRAALPSRSRRTRK